MLCSEEVALYYQWFLDVEVMIFLGFGFLMTFLRRYSYSAVAFNFFISAFVMIYSVLIIGGVQQAGRACVPPRASHYVLQTSIPPEGVASGWSQQNMYIRASWPAEPEPSQPCHELTKSS